MEKNLVSIIIPIYNVSPYLHDCVQSTCNQTYRNLEIILVDDGSPDDCPAKCDEWAKRDSRIKVIHKKNGGLSDARNAGLDVATGTYIYFLDGDDYIKPEMVETVVRYMDDGADMVAFGYDKVFNTGEIKPGAYHELGLFELADAESRFSFVSEKILCEKLGWEAWSRIYSREIIEKYRMRFADNRRIFAEDMYFCLCYCAHVKTVVSIDQSLYYYRLREDSIMGKDGKKRNIGRINELAKAALEHFGVWDDCKVFVNRFPVIHYQLMDHIIAKSLSLQEVSAETYRDIILGDLQDREFFALQIKKLPQWRKLLENIYSGGQALERVNIMRYVLDGNKLLFRVRCWVNYKLWDVLDQQTSKSKEIQHQYKKLSQFKKRIYLLGTEEYGNVGDHQINESVIAFLEKALPEYYIHEVTAREWPRHRKLLEKFIRKEDLIVFAGGGNFGDTYPVAQNIRAEVIRCWPENVKILFPQTAYFSDTEKGRQALAEAQGLYTKEYNMVVFAREQASYDFIKKNFSCNCYLAPDIVLSASVQQGTERQDQVLLCLRRDVEKTMLVQDALKIEQLCSAAGLAVKRTDLQLDCHVDRVYRKEIIEEKLALWRSAKLLITDRLHGMVFAAITGTPCIVFSNFNHKVRGTYEWIRYLPYIRYAESAEDVEWYLPELLAMDTCQYDNTPLVPYFEKLAKVVKEYAHHQRDSACIQS